MKYSVYTRPEFVTYADLKPGDPFLKPFDAHLIIYIKSDEPNQAMQLCKGEIRSVADDHNVCKVELITPPQFRMYKEK